MSILRALAVVLVTASSAFAQTPPAQGTPSPQAPAAPARGRQGPPPLGPNGTRDPFPTPIPAEEGVIKLNFVEFATLPDVEGNTARPMLMSYEPGTRRMFVNDMHGALYSVSHDGKTVAPYLDHRDPRWNLQVQFQNFERGFQSFAFHPQFNQRGARRLRQVLHLHGYEQQDAAARLAPPGGGKIRTTRCCWNGPRRTRPPPPTTAARRAS